MSRRVQISVMTMAGKVLSLDVRTTDTVGHVKTNIHRELGVPPPRQRLVLDGKVLQDGRTLASYGVGAAGKAGSSCCRLHLAVRRELMEIFVKVPSGRTLIITVEGSDTVGSVMEKVRQKEGVPLDPQRVVYAEKQLEHGRTLAEYNVMKESTLCVILRLGGPHKCADFAGRSNCLCNGHI
ncbi:polyubiquitin-like [Aegilops tauschii subsp. strangulata]|uniref:polyubiquitin-like n=1 Tax=Aegilops tauschii subsp. strangulata TaxID=200361 RepID=UPI00098A4DDA|nr:polyubiquitin-like [Aegilops tauschii subsp. strangulata]